MNRNKKLLQKRTKQIGLAMEIKKSKSNYSWKKAIIELSENFLISNATVRSELQKYNSQFTTV